jgi:hypothetical protein
VNKAKSIAECGKYHAAKSVEINQEGRRLHLNINKIQNTGGSQAGPDLSLCGTGEADLEVQNMTDGEAKFVWTYNHQTLANSKTMKVTSAGQYIVTSDSDGCYQKDTIAIKDDLRPELGPDQNICSSSFITLNAGLTGKGLTFLWSKDGVKLNGITSSTLTTKDGGSYTVTVSGSGCPDVSDTINISSGLLKANDVTGQYGKEVTISVQGDANSYNWYLHEDDATAAYSGATYTTTLSNGSQYIYVSDPNGYDGLVGKKSLNSEASYTNTDFTRRMEFETFRPLNIDRRHHCRPETLQCRRQGHSLSLRHQWTHLHQGQQRRVD